MTKRIEGKVAAILDKTTVVINIGAEDSVEVGDTFYVLSTVGPIVDPDSGEELGKTTRIWGELEVQVVEPRLSVARTQLQDPWFSFQVVLPGLFRSKRRILPVESAKLAGVPDKIHVGSKVISAKQQHSFEQGPQGPQGAQGPQASDVDSRPQDIDLSDEANGGGTESK